MEMSTSEGTLREIYSLSAEKHACNSSESVSDLVPVRHSTDELAFPPHIYGISYAALQRAWAAYVCDQCSGGSFVTHSDVQFVSISIKPQVRPILSFRGSSGGRITDL